MLLFLQSNYFTRCVLFACVLLISVSSKVLADPKSHKSHQTHQRYGSHGMVLFTDDQENIYASHLPLYATPHDYQIIYQMVVPNKQRVLAELRQGMVTLLPSKFDLNQLVTKEVFTISAYFYAGHFERGGMQFDETNIEFHKAILVEPITHNYQSLYQVFYKAKLNDHTDLVVHKIQRPPSFDAIAVMRNVEHKQTMYQCNKPKVVSHVAISNALEQCGIKGIRYLETQDFTL
ncbi:hypothetical protein CWB96_21790 [Pseudoalteromonas citrea]|uniref:Uncharacterized protein n=1 Tax=Pseudoalteromonas citrea TaxID=43655 RepID=A0A5S3XG60_9GAMM|nr:hypothetical protein [Pseudoalteromonas citrea]TMP37855.1 hypothetical protein CWB97_22435 [Pseudoalteromonas citrea]TMP52388.1 hypothetical protein CWB96_21790 [Pseudoalteromonas citrea]